MRHLDLLTKIIQEVEVLLIRDLVTDLLETIEMRLFIKIKANKIKGRIVTILRLKKKRKGKERSRTRQLKTISRHTWLRHK